MPGIQSNQFEIAGYLDRIRGFPMLEPDEEYELAKSWRERGDQDAVHRLVTSHLRLVARIASGYRGYGLPISELISEGSLGLLHAVKRFEPDKGFRLATYAMWWIKAAMHEYILRSWSLVKIGTTASQRKLFFSLRKVKGSISAIDQGDLRPDQVRLIAERLQVPEQDVVDMNRRLGGDVSLNAPTQAEGDSGEWQDSLVDDSTSQEINLLQSEEADNRRKALRNALALLKGRERRIFEARKLADEPPTLEELADEIGVSPERVRQIEMRAFAKVQGAVRAQIAAADVALSFRGGAGPDQVLAASASCRPLNDGDPCHGGSTSRRPAAQSVARSRPIEPMTRAASFAMTRTTAPIQPYQVQPS
jgi:RNA polymerase sigma-32 factor